MWQRNSGNAYLNAEYYSIENKENNLKQFEKNKEIIKMYNPEKINDMNEKIGNQTIKNLGIAIFVLTLASFIIFIIAFLCSNNQQKDTKLNNFNCNCTSSDAFGLIIIIMAIIFSFVFLYIWCIIKLLDLFLGKESDLQKYLLGLFLIFLPELILEIISLVLAFLKKNIIDDYLSMENIDIFINEDVKSVQDNLVKVIILMIINIVIFVLYLILACFSIILTKK